MPFSHSRSKQFLQLSIVLFLGLGASFLVDKASAASATWPAGVNYIPPNAGQTTTVLGDLSAGKTVNLAFATSSNVACFPATQNPNFTGNHVFYATQLPRQSQLTVTAIPSDPNVDISLYMYTIGTTDYRQIPPNVSRASCEASYDAQNNSNPGKSETAKVVSTTNPYNVVIGVAGANGKKVGAYTLKLELVTAAGPGSMTNLVPIPVESKSGQVVQVQGEIGSGKTIDLAWATRSSVACFPATENLNFAGKHILYRTSIPAQSEMVITAIPSNPSLDLSVYAYTVGTTDTTTVPPTMERCGACESDYDAQHDSNPGVSESVKITAIQNPYNVFIGVVGAKADSTGAYTLKIETKARQ